MPAEVVYSQVAWANVRFPGGIVLQNSVSSVRCVCPSWANSGLTESNELASVKIVVKRPLVSVGN